MFSFASDIGVDFEIEFSYILFIEIQWHWNCWNAMLWVVVSLKKFKCKTYINRNNSIEDELKKSI